MVGVVGVDCRPPMRDFVADGVSGVLLQSARKRPIGNNMFQLQHVHVQAAEIVTAVKRVEGMSNGERQRMGAAARKRFETERTEFQRTMRLLGEAVCGAAETGGGKAARLDPRLKLM